MQDFFHPFSRGFPVAFEIYKLKKLVMPVVLKIYIYNAIFVQSFNNNNK